MITLPATGFPVTAVAVAPVPLPPLNEIVGVDVYPLPTLSTVILTTTTKAVSQARGHYKYAVAVAPLPPPPLIVTVGAVVYPLPPAVTLIVPTTFSESLPDKPIT